LIAGGYLILDPEQNGLVLALSARIHVVVSSNTTSPSQNGGVISVTSPQFLNARWTYQWSRNDSQSELKVTDLYRPSV
jgi:phosphomevalonate kinase